MRIPFASRLLQRAATALQGVRLGVLDADEKQALLRLLYGVALADGVVSNEEQQVIVDAAQRLGVPWNQAADDGALQAAVATLAKHPRTLKLACLVVADAFFVDGDYDKAEKEFVASFQQRFQLPANPLRDAVLALRTQKLDAALADWNREITG